MGVRSPWSWGNLLPDYHISADDTERVILSSSNPWNICFRLHLLQQYFGLRPKPASAPPIWEMTQFRRKFRLQRHNWVWLNAFEPGWSPEKSASPVALHSCLPLVGLNRQKGQEIIHVEMSTSLSRLLFSQGHGGLTLCSCRSYIGRHWITLSSCQALERDWKIMISENKPWQGQLDIILWAHVKGRAYEWHTEKEACQLLFGPSWQF